MAEGAPSQANIDKMWKYAEKYADKSGTSLHPDRSVPEPRQGARGRQDPREARRRSLSDAEDHADVSDPADLIETYFERGWTDGLPVVPPTEKSIAAMLDAARLRGDEVFGEIPGRNTVVVADKVAINAVLAGCRPEYFPVVGAAVKALCHPTFAYHGPASSTGGSAIVLLVNGPITK